MQQTSSGTSGATSSPSPPAGIAKWAPWAGAVSLILWFVGPIAIVMGLVIRHQGRRDPATARPVRATTAVVLGALGTGLLVVSTIGNALKDERPTASTAAAAAVPSASSNADAERAATEARQKADEARDERERTAAVVKAAMALAADQVIVRGTLDAAKAALDKHNVSGARKQLAGLASRFLPLDRAYLIPDDNADAATRDALRTATDMLARYEQESGAAEQQRTAAYNAAFEMLWAPANAGRNEDQLLAGVGRKFGLSLDEMKALMLEHDAESTRRLKERSDAEEKTTQDRASAAAAALEAQCGPKPMRSAWDNGLPAAEDYVKASAHDPGSIDVEHCTDPVVSAGTCWATVCDVRGKNVLGAKVLTRMRFTIGKNPDAPSIGVVTGAQKL